MTNKGSLTGFCVIAIAAVAISSAQAGELIAVTDAYQFDGLTTSALSTAPTYGSAVGGPSITSVLYPLNGIGLAPGGELYGADPYGNTLRTLQYNGTLTNSVSAGASGFNSGGNCCSEQFAMFDGNLYHGQYGSGIQQVDPSTGALLASYNGDPGVVGLADIGGTLWATNWGAGEVGTFDLGTNTFTSVFSVPDVTGALAWDAGDSILWVGGSDRVYAYTLGGALLNSYVPFPAGADTIDGLAYVPEPITLSLFGLGLAGTVAMRRRKKTALNA